MGVEKMEINKPKDKNNMTDSEKKHIPVIEVDGDRVIVKVGEITHPMEAEHYITFIELFRNNESIEKKELKPVDKPEAVFENVVLGNLKVQANCNQHGLWESISR
jgi:superoxide reductase